MSFFDFPDAKLNPSEKHPKSIGTVQSVDNGRVFIQISSSEKLQMLRIGSIVAILGGTSRYIIAHASRIWRRQSTEELSKSDEEGETIDNLSPIPENNGALLTLLGCIREREEGQKFSRSMDDLPGIDEEVFLLADKNLTNFMNVVSATSKTALDIPLHLGQFSLDISASAYLDGNKLFQRHTALLGSTGSGKSWAVARILEQASKLPQANIVLLDLHGEYCNLGYAKQYKIAGPADLDTPEENILFLPYWLLSFEEMQALFVERSEFSAQNQSLVIYKAVSHLKREKLKKENKDKVLSQFTIDSPVVFDIKEVIQCLTKLNQEKVMGANKREKNGPYHGQFDRLLPRLEGKISDRRYGFMYSAPADWCENEALSQLAQKLLCNGKDGNGNKIGIKVIDLSEVPSDVLPLVTGTLARLIYNLQFWTPANKRHPILIACDEAHRYLPKLDFTNPLERSAVENFSRIAKEGRKYGVGLMVISQRPSDISETILSQCNNLISLRLTNPSDQQTVRKLLPDSLGDLLQTLPLMDVGEAVVLGDAVLLPARIKIAQPVAKPISSTIEFWDEWGKEKSIDSALFSIISENYRRQERLES